MSDKPQARNNSRPPSRHCAAALGYAERGWAVFPLQPGGKEPRTRHGLHDATTDATRIRRWWRSCPSANVGIATGPVVVVDVDGATGRASLAALEDEYGPLPPTLTAATARGVHLYFLAPKGPAIPNSAGRLGTALDVRGLGGYVAAPPSLHPSGRRYRWANRTAPVTPPAWLTDLLRPRPQRSTRRKPLPGSLEGADRAERYLLAALQGECETVATAAEGTRNDTLNRAAFRLGQLSAAIPAFDGDQELTAALLDAADAAGLPEAESAATIASGLRAGHEHPRRLPGRGRRSR